jgi:hypothetical protein
MIEIRAILSRRHQLVCLDNQLDAEGVDATESISILLSATEEIIRFETVRVLRRIRNIDRSHGHRLTFCDP